MFTFVFLWRFFSLTGLSGFGFGLGPVFLRSGRFGKHFSTCTSSSRFQSGLFILSIMPVNRFWFRSKVASRKTAQAVIQKFLVDCRNIQVMIKIYLKILRFPFLIITEQENEGNTGFCLVLLSYNAINPYPIKPIMRLALPRKTYTLKNYSIFQKKTTSPLANLMSNSQMSCGGHFASAGISAESAAETLHSHVFARGVQFWSYIHPAATLAALHALCILWTAHAQCTYRLETFSCYKNFILYKSRASL